ncbi:MAG: hypothetical protein RLZZ359_979 [Actinomycetota bacterium]
MAYKPRPSLDELRGSARVVSLPLRTKFRGLIEREVMLLEGPQGWTEWSPFVEYEDAEASIWLNAAIEFGWSAEVANLPADTPSAIAVNAILPAVAPESVPQILNRFGRFSTVKIKVAEAGQSIEQDLARIDAALEFNPDAKIRLDANGGYSVQQALEIANQLSAREIAVEYLEQPVASVAEMAELRAHLAPKGIKIAADENVRKAADPLAVARAQAADILVLKAAPLGGISKAIEIAGQANLPVVVSSAMDSSVGLSMGAFLAAKLPNHGFAAGLGTASLLAADVTREPLKPVDGKIDVRRVEVDQAALDRHRAEDHRVDWWLERLAAAYSALENQG